MGNVAVQPPNQESDFDRLACLFMHFNSSMIAVPFRGSQFLIGYLSLICLLCILMSELHCIQGCSRTFATDRHLSQHKKRCPQVQVIREKAHEMRRERGLGSTVLKDVTSLGDRKQRLQVIFVFS